MKTGSIVGSPTTKDQGVTDASTGYQKTAEYSRIHNNRCFPIVRENRYLSNAIQKKQAPMSTLQRGPYQWIPQQPMDRSGRPPDQREKGLSSHTEEKISVSPGWENPYRGYTVAQEMGTGYPEACRTGKQAHCHNHESGSRLVLGDE